MQVELNDIETHAYLINSDSYHYKIKQIIRELCSDISLALPFIYSFTRYDIVSSFYGKGKCKAYGVWVKCERKDDFFDGFVELGEKSCSRSRVLCCSYTDRDMTHSVPLSLTNSKVRR